MVILKYYLDFFFLGKVSSIFADQYHIQVVKSIPLLIINIFIIIFLFGSCKVFNPAMPVENYKYQNLLPHNSVINLYADIEVIKLENLINAKIDSVLYNDSSFEDHDGDNLMLKAWKDGRIGLQFEDNQLKWEIPVRILMKKGLKIFNYNVPLVDSWEYSGNLMLRFRTNISFNPDWSIKTLTTADNCEWIKKPSVKIGSQSFPVTYLANLILSTNRKAITEQIDKVFAENGGFKKYNGKSWKIIF